MHIPGIIPLPFYCRELAPWGPSRLAARWSPCSPQSPRSSVGPLRIRGQPMVCLPTMAGARFFFRLVRGRGSNFFQNAETTATQGRHFLVRASSQSAVPSQFLTLGLTMLPSSIIGHWIARFQDEVLIVSPQICSDHVIKFKFTVLFRRRRLTGFDCSSGASDMESAQVCGFYYCYIW